MITKILFGLTNDDFMEDRITGKVFTSNDTGTFLPIKIYRNPSPGVYMRFVSFVDYRLIDGEYEEKDLGPKTEEEIRKYMHDHDIDPFTS